MDHMHGGGGIHNLSSSSPSSSTFSFSSVATNQSLMRLEEFGAVSLTVVTVYLFLITALGISSNVMLLVVFLRHKHLQTPFNWLFMNLTAADLLVSAGGTCVAAAHTAARAVMGAWTCQAYGFITYLGGSASIMAVTMLAIERFVCIIHPCNLGAVTHRRVMGYITFTWLYVLVFAAGPLLGWAHYRHEALGTWCSIDWEESSPATDAYIVVIFVASFFLPLTVVVLCYATIYYKVHQVASSSQPGVATSAAKAESTVLRQSVAIVVCLMLSWTPYAIVCLCVAIIKYNPFPVHVAVAPSLFAKTSTCWNPVIYFGLNKQFREEFLKMIHYSPGTMSPTTGRRGKKPKGKGSQSFCNATVGETRSPDLMEDRPALQPLLKFSFKNKQNSCSSVV